MSEIDKFTSSVVDWLSASSRTLFVQWKVLEHYKSLIPLNTSKAILSLYEIAISSIEQTVKLFNESVEEARKDYPDREEDDIDKEFFMNAIKNAKSTWKAWLSQESTISQITWIWNQQPIDVSGLIESLKKAQNDAILYMDSIES